MLKITELMNSLSKTRPVFHSEDDFKFALAWQIHKKWKDCQVRLEYPFHLEDEKDKRKFVDIYLPEKEFAVELKYKTKKLKVELENETFDLTNQAAQVEGVYFFHRDISRLEKMVASDQTKVKAGLAVLLTNDPSYWKPPKKNTLINSFSPYDGRKIEGVMKWPEIKQWMKKDGIDKPIELLGSYTLEWQKEDYSSLGNGNNERFRYLAVEVTG